MPIRKLNATIISVIRFRRHLYVFVAKITARDVEVSGYVSEGLADALRLFGVGAGEFVRQDGAGIAGDDISADGGGDGVGGYVVVQTKNNLRVIFRLMVEYGQGAHDLYVRVTVIIYEYTFDMQTEK